jgi:demethylmenaquinone methyltransferase/2-methoxy-6-polyprenyl-1,4-benzoquinol methylase
MVGAIAARPDDRVLDVATGTGLVAAELVRRYGCSVVGIDQSEEGATMRELARVVRPGGTVASLEFGVPPATVPRALWLLYTRVGLPALGRLVSRDWYEVGRFLGPSISGFWRDHPLAALRALWLEAGIGRVETRRMSLGGGVVMWGVREGGGAAA